jgi:Na+/phosphate symporter
MAAWISLIIAIIGLIMYLATTHEHKISKLGLVMFAAGMFAIAFAFARDMVKLF